MLKLQNISKSFPGVRALSDVSLEIRPGEVHALVGENGAGKSTLMNILAGNLTADRGTIILDGQPVKIGDSKHSRSLGISIVHQERTLVENLNVAENIFTTHPPTIGWGLIDYDRLHRATESLLRRLNLPGISSDQAVFRLSAGQKQMVEIAKALSMPSRVMILDEPTASIAQEETETLFRIIKELTTKGVAVIYISHRMNEIRRVADTVSILKDGRLQGTVPSSTPIREIINKMVGRELSEVAYQDHSLPDVVLEVRQWSGRRFKNVDFSLHRGEILGFAGLVGSGRTEIAKAIFGEAPASGGSLYKNGRRLTIRKPADAIANRIVYVPEERINQAIFPEMTVEDNILAAWQGGIWRKLKEGHRVSVKQVDLLRIKTPSLDQKIVKLSGGNQQKVILSRWLTLDPEVLIVDEPTQGVDVGSKYEIYQLLKKLAREGIGIMMISSELPELLMIADRIAVMHNGELRKILDRREATEEAIMHWASGTVHETRDRL